MRQRKKAFWTLFGLSILTALLMWGLGIYGGASNSAGAINTTASAAPQATAIHPWTAVASTGVVDESALGYFGFGLPGAPGASAGYRPGSPAIQPIVLRYNVTNTFDNNVPPFMPGWDTLEFGSFSPANSVVRATLYRVRICSGVQEAVCSVINQENGATCDTCRADALGPIDFANFLYYVEVLMRRSDEASLPRAHTLRLY